MPIQSGFSELAQALTALCFPPRCLLCNQPTARQHICPACRPAIHRITPPFCHRCGIPHLSTVPENHRCGLCLKDHWHFDSARSLVLYQSPFAELITSFKFAGNLSVLPLFSELFQHGVSADPPYRHTTIITPVPLSRQRLRQRGFNQSLELIRAFFPKAGPRIRPQLLVRTRHTAPQTTKSGNARRASLKGAFALGRNQNVKGEKVLLVDDVLTTGTTVNECASVLRKAGASEIHVLTLARVHETGGAPGALETFCNANCDPPR